MTKGKNTPAEVLTQWGRGIKKEYKTAFVAAFLCGLLIHMPVILSDIPNHDGLGSMYFDQNMITSGRWFLTVACGFSSYYTIPWVIGLLGIGFLALAAAALTALLELKDNVSIVAVSGLLVSFPALASTFSYVFTLDGYMMALLFAVLSVLFTHKYKWGFVPGAFFLAFSMGTYQAYLPFAILLCYYQVLLVFMEQGGFKEKIKKCANYLYMGVLGVALYYLILQLLLAIQGKELASYQGINGMSSGFDLSSIIHMYRDFASFTIKGNVLFNNAFSLVACGVLAASVMIVLIKLCIQKKWWKYLGFYAIIVVSVLVLPLVTNIILLISPQVTYHLLMRYQWVVYLILGVAFVQRFAGEDKSGISAQWGVCLAAAVLVFNYGVTDNIGYSNLEKRYEKTYAYCVRLLDRIEQTEGYYQGIPIAMVGVVGYNPYPVTDITMDVTAELTGLNGDTLLYTGENYEVFMKNYLGASLNMMTPEEMKDIYYSQEYIEMESFPAASSIKIVDGIMYVKTENVGRD